MGVAAPVADERPASVSLVFSSPSKLAMIHRVCGIGLYGATPLPPNMSVFSFADCSVNGFFVEIKIYDRTVLAA